MDHKAVRTEIIFTGFSTKVDGSLSVRATTPELNTVEKIAFMDLQGLLCEALIFPKEEREAEVVEVRHEMDHKTPSQRMRGVLFLLWKQEREDIPFETFYSQRMESMLDWLKRKLDEKSGVRDW